MNGKVIACDGSCQAIVDTKTSLLIGPPNSIGDIRKKINAQHFSSEYIIECDAIHTLPDLVFTINGVKYPVPASAYIQQAADGGRGPEEAKLCHCRHHSILLAGPDVDVERISRDHTAPDKELRVSECQFPREVREGLNGSKEGFQNHPDICHSKFEEYVNRSHNTNTWVLGDVFLRLSFSVFDGANDRIGLAPAA
ncbi:hypothetical protein P7K49_021726 [Saguinus oedipus]|uniref:Peptidase A1 domain-containing protein n=1 Tax=Saguinus oedipus TaxID=9490 RepID=A0ABQ9UTG6_SAGOE|nr:hypothetical protein P7K49_021726 [Saguinus oedipus]